MSEISYYNGISTKFKSILECHLPEGSKVAFSYNQPLPRMIEELERETKCQTVFNGTYVPNLQLDILLGIKLPRARTLDLVLIEVKYLYNLSLTHFSQLAGYLQVAKFIRTGLLLLARGATISGYNGTLSFDWYKNEMKIVHHHKPYSDIIKTDGNNAHFGGDISLARNFIDVIEGRKESLSPITAGIQSVYTCLAAKESVISNKFVKVRQIGYLQCIS